MTEPGAIDILLPGPTEGSGGIRTAVAAAESVAATGRTVNLHVETGNAGSRKAAAMAERTREWFDVRRCRVTSGWPSRLPRSAMVMGTTWRSAAAAARVDTSAVRAHFVQDYECWFHPRDDDFLAASGVFDLGLRTVVIGDWLPQVLLRHHGLTVWSVPFTADRAIYRPGKGPTGPVVVAMYQPDKPRRCGQLMKASLERLLEINPGVRVTTVGGRADPRLGARHEHRGVVSRDELADLYRGAAVGLSMSATNPSRVPFEMMATGLPVVELGLWNNTYDLPEEATRLARPDPDSVADALDGLLRDEGARAAMARAAADYMKSRPADLEGAAFVAAVDAILTGDQSPKPVETIRYASPPVVSQSARPWDGGPRPGRWETRRRRLLGR